MTRHLFHGALGMMTLTWAFAAEPVFTDDFYQVCAALRAVTGIEADFAEDKTLHILQRPLHSTGKLMFSPTQGVYRVMEEPVHQELLISRSLFVQRNADGVVERMSVRRQQSTKAFVDIFLSFFSGDWKTWDRAFNVTFSGTLMAWKMRFVPRPNNPAARALHEAVLEGSQGVLNAMTITEANGDVTRTVYSNQRPLTHPFPADLGAP
jgi:hypothetical protein